MDLQQLAEQLRKPQGEKGDSIGKMMSEGNAKMYEKALSVMDINPKGKLLEIGFGNGQLIPKIIEKEPQVKYTGVDYSELMVQQAMDLINSKGLQHQVEINHASVSSLPFGNNIFDIVFTVNTLYFWDNPIEDAKEIYRVLKPGGTLYLSFRPKDMAERLPFTQYGFHLYSLEEAKSLLSDVGFKNFKDYFQDEGIANVKGTDIRFSSFCLKAMKN